MDVNRLQRFSELLLGQLFWLLADSNEFVQARFRVNEFSEVPGQLLGPTILYRILLLHFSNYELIVHGRSLLRDEQLTVYLLNRLLIRCLLTEDLLDSDEHVENLVVRQDAVVVLVEEIEDHCHLLRNNHAGQQYNRYQEIQHIHHVVRARVRIHQLRIWLEPLVHQL